MTAADCKDKKDFRAKHGPDLFMTNIDEYDRICKVSYMNVQMLMLGYAMIPCVAAGRAAGFAIDQGAVMVLARPSLAVTDPASFRAVSSVYTGGTVQQSTQDHKL